MSVNLLKALTAELDSCNKCGFCMSACPTYQVSNREWLVTRGRVSAVQDLLRGDLSLAEVAPAVDTCLLCRACVEVCPPKVPIDYLMTRARAAAKAERPLPAAARLLLRQVLGRPRMLRLAARVAGAAERLDLRALAAHSGLLRRWPTLKRAHETGPSLSGATARDLLRTEPLTPSGEVRATVAYFVTCTKQAVFPEAARAAVRVLVAAGCEVVLPEVPCCGLPCLTAGDLDGARALARRHAELLNALAVDAVVVDDGSCAAHLLELHELFRDLPGAEPVDLRVRVCDLATFLTELGARPRRPLRARVTWHDPCHLRHYMKVAAAPRDLIRAVDGVEYVEAADAAMCCGGAGAIMLTQPEVSDAVLAHKLRCFADTAADLVVTSSPSCLMQVGRGVREQMPGARVLSLAEFLEQTYV